MGRKFTTTSKDDKMADDKKKKYGSISFDALSEGQLPGESSSQHVAGKVVYKPEKNCPQCGGLNPNNADKCMRCDFDFRSSLDKLLGTGPSPPRDVNREKVIEETKELLKRSKAIVPVSGGIVPTGAPTQQGVLRRKATVADTTCTKCGSAAKLITDKDGIVSIDCPTDGRFIFSVPSGPTIPTGPYPMPQLPAGAAAQAVAQVAATIAKTTWASLLIGGLKYPFTATPIFFKSLGIVGGFLSEKISDRVKKNILEVIALMLGAVISGFLGFYFLATALALAAFWIILPSQSSLMGEVNRYGEFVCPQCRPKIIYKSPGYCKRHPTVQLVPQESREINLETKHVGSLYMRSFIKLLIIIFLVLEFSLYHPYHILIPIAVLFIGYFSLPTKYYNDEPYKAADAWFRQLLGFVIAFFVLSFLTPAYNAAKLVSDIFGIVLTFIAIIPAALTYTKFKSSKFALPATILVLLAFMIPISLVSTYFGNPALSIFYLCVAFFTTRPVKEERKSSQGNPIIVNTTVFAGAKGGAKAAAEKLGITDKESIDALGNGVFISLMLAGGIPILITSGGGQFAITFFIVWLMSIFMGYVGGREGRPYLGIIMVSFAILAFSFQYGDTIGFAVFKQYWAPLKSFTTVNLAPALEGINQANKQLSLGVECAFDPVGCQQRQQWQQRQQSIALGSQFALEEAEYSAQPADSIDVNIPTFVSLTMENRGDFDIPPGAKITLTIPEAKFADVRAAGQAQRAITKQVGDISSLKCTPAPQETALTKTCTFKDIFVKSKGGTGGRALAQFELVWKKLDELQTGATINEGGKKIILQPDAPTYNVTLSFRYSATAEYKRDVFSEAELTKRLLNPSQFPDFNPTGLESKYSGGPVLAAVWMPPIQIGSENLITGSVVNQRGGTAKNFKYCLYFPKTIVADYGTSSFTNSAKDGCDPIAGFIAVRCSNPTKKLLPSGTVESSELLSANKQIKAPLDSYDCSFKMKFNTQNVPKRELNILATLSYEYENTIVKFLPPLPPFGISSTDTGGGSSGG